MGRHRYTEALDEHPVPTAFVTLAVGALMVAGVQSQEIPPIAGEVPDGVCFSPYAVSDKYIDTGASWATPVLGGRTGLAITVPNAPGSDVLGMQVAFDDPTDDDPTADDSTDSTIAWQVSGMIPPEASGPRTLRVAIGEGLVRFGVRVVAPAGSPSCDIVPAVIFRYEDDGIYQSTEGQSPWPNLGEQIAKLGLPVPPV